MTSCFFLRLSNIDKDFTKRCDSTAISNPADGIRVLPIWSLQTTCIIMCSQLGCVFLRCYIFSSESLTQYFAFTVKITTKTNYPNCTKLGMLSHRVTISITADILEFWKTTRTRMVKSKRLTKLVATMRANSYHTGNTYHNNNIHHKDRPGNK